VIASARFIVARVFLPFMLAYFVSEMFRNINAVVGPAIRRDLDLSPEELGFLTSMFLVTVASVQVIVGIFLDRYGARRTVAGLLTIGAAGSFLFSLGIYEAMLVGRCLIGLGMAGCWTAAFKVNAQWWPHERLALANGATLGFAGLGALAATLPAQFLLERMEWNAIFAGAGAMTFLVALAVLLVAPDHPDEIGKRRDGRSLYREFREFGTVMKAPVFLVVGPASILCQGVWLSYQGLWSGVWLREVSGASPVAAASILFVFAASIIIGNLVIGILADLAQRRGISLMTATAVLSSAYVVVQLVILTTPLHGSVVMWSLFGLLLAGPIFSYALLSRALPTSLSGRAVSLLNLFATLAAFVIQYGVGVVVELWPPGADGTYPAAAHRTAFALVVGIQVAAVAWMVLAMLRRPAPCALAGRVSQGD